MAISKVACMSNLMSATTSWGNCPQTNFTMIGQNKQRLPPSHTRRRQTTVPGPTTRATHEDRPMHTKYGMAVTKCIGTRYNYVIPNTVKWCRSFMKQRKYQTQLTKMSSKKTPQSAPLYSNNYRGSLNWSGGLNIWCGDPSHHMSPGESPDHSIMPSWNNSVGPYIQQANCNKVRLFTSSRAED